MAARTPPIGIDHPTVVPTNFDPERGVVDEEPPDDDPEHPAGDDSE